MKKKIRNINITTTLPIELNNSLDEFCRDNRTKKTDVIRRSLDIFFKEGLAVENTMLINKVMELEKTVKVLSKDLESKKAKTSKESIQEEEDRFKAWIKEQNLRMVLEVKKHPERYIFGNLKVEDVKEFAVELLRVKCG